MVLVVVRRAKSWWETRGVGSYVGKGDESALGATENRDQSDFTTPTDGAILLHGASRVSGKLLLELCAPCAPPAPFNYVSFLFLLVRFVLNVLSFHMRIACAVRFPRVKCPLFSSEKARGTRLKTLANCVRVCF